VAASASGYLSKEAEPDEIRRAIRTVASGSSFIAPTPAGYLLDDAGAKSKSSGWSPRANATTTSPPSCSSA